MDVVPNVRLSFKEITNNSAVVVLFLLGCILASHMQQNNSQLFLFPSCLPAVHQEKIIEANNLGKVHRVQELDIGKLEYSLILLKYEQNFFL